MIGCQHAKQADYAQLRGELANLPKEASYLGIPHCLTAHGLPYEWLHLSGWIPTPPYFARADDFLPSYYRYWSLRSRTMSTALLDSARHTLWQKRSSQPISSVYEEHEACASHLIRLRDANPLASPDTTTSSSTGCIGAVGQPHPRPCRSLAVCISPVAHAGVNDRGSLMRRMASSVRTVAHRRPPESHCALQRNTHQVIHRTRPNAGKHAATNPIATSRALPLADLQSG